MTKGQFIGIMILGTLLVLGVSAIASVLTREHLQRTNYRARRRGGQNMVDNPDGTVTDTNTGGTFAVNQDGEFIAVSTI